MESRVKFRRPQSISETLQQNIAATSSETTEVDGDVFWLYKEPTINNPHLQSPSDPKLIWKDVIHTLDVRALARASDGARANALS